MIEDTERLDLPSSSSAHRRRRCVGSEKLIAELRARGLLRKLPTSPEALSGSRVHAAWAGQDVILTESESATLAAVRRIETMLLADWSADSCYYLIGREERLWLRNGIEPLLSGQYDVAYGQGVPLERVLILDAKTLYGEIEPAEYNDQLRELVALLRFNEPTCEAFRVAIICPNLAQRCTIADYDQTEAELALRLTRLVLADSQDTEAPRTPGFYCHKCPAVLQCEEARQLVGATYNLAKRIEEGQFALPLGEKGSRMLDNIRTAEPLLAALKSAYKRELERDPDCLPGWRLRPGKKVRKISRVASAFEYVAAAGLGTSEFFQATELHVSKLEAILGVALGLEGRALRARFDEIFRGVLEQVTYAPELVKVRANGQAPKALEHTHDAD
jgi:Protein of unknown function (DUF2800)